jgi:16S rRNA C967 or C1407 C5-methylase (RsmB/RsmF family)/NOL1/NOP2/fmu family ribosome biogenesis protein
MFPHEFMKRLRDQHYIDVDGLLSALEEPAPVSIRINTTKWNRIPLSATPVPWCNSGWYLEKRPAYTLDPLYHAGCYYPQEASGMFLETAFNQFFPGNESIKVLDLCGAPGGKSTHLSTLIGERGYLVANEVVKSRASVLAENITKWGIPNTIVTSNDPSAFGALRNYFDLVIVDAPCSGEGMFRDSVALKEWSSSNAAMCSDRQKRILMDVWPALKEEGILIYGTCTFNPSENEENIKWLNDNTDSESLRINISSSHGIKEIAYRDITGYGFHPGRIKGEGYFLSALRKLENSDTITVKRKKFKYSAAPSDVKMVLAMIKNTLDDIYRHSDTVYKLSLPFEEFLYLKSSLNIIKGGTALFKSRKGDISPLPELAFLSQIRDDAFPVYDLDYREALAFLRKENLILRNHPEGWIVVRYLGVNLGFIKNIGTRINNYFPVEWRIRLGDSSLSDAGPVAWR